MCCSTDQRIHNISPRRLPPIRGGVTLLWLENPCCSSSPSNAGYEMIDRLRTLNNYYILRYTTVAKCIKYVKRAGSFERVIIVMVINGGSIVGKETSITVADVSRLHHYQQVQSIFIVSPTNENNDDTIINFPKNARGDDINKVVGVYRDHQSMFVQLQQLLGETEECDDDLFTTFNQREKVLRDVHHELGQFVWSHSYRVILTAMPYHSSEAKREMLAECRTHHRGNRHELTAIDEFGRTYRSADAIHWYTKPCFLYRVINKVLRTQDIFAPYKFRYFIVDLCAHLEKAAAATRARHTKPFRVYRGARLSRDEVEQLHVGMLVAPNEFFSSSKHLQVAQEFISIDVITGMSPSRSREDRRQYVLFEIDIDLINSPDLIIADVSGQSAIPDENEMMFGLGTTFKITHINYDVEHYVWNIKMVSSSEIAQLNRDYNDYISRRLTEVNATVLFGSLVATISGEYVKAMTYFQHMLRTMPADDENRPNIYYQLARVYRYMSKYQEAIEYFRCALLLQRCRLPQSSFDYARTLSELGTIYSELGDSARAVKLHTKAMVIHRRLLPEDHFEMAINSNRLAYAYWQEREYERALALLSSALSFFKRKMPADHPGQAQTLHTMGLVQRALGNRDQALDYLKGALRMRESLLADDHPCVAHTCYELSVLYAERDDEKKIALDYALRALRIRKAKLSPNSDDLKQSIRLVEQLSQTK